MPEKKYQLNKAVILDRDGTIIHDRPGYYLSSPKKLKVYKYAFKALKILSQLGFKLFIVSNQSGIGRGYFSRKTVNNINRRLLKILGKYSIRIKAVYICPHAPEKNCKCRKPLPFMGEKIIKKYHINPEISYAIGDKFSDIKFGQNLKMRTIFLLSGHGKSEIKKYGKKIRAHKISKNIFFGAKWVLKNEIQN